MRAQDKFSFFVNSNDSSFIFTTSTLGPVPDLTLITSYPTFGANPNRWCLISVFPYFVTPTPLLSFFPFSLYIRSANMVRAGNGKCGKCKKRLQLHQRSTPCTSCKASFHIKCSSASTCSKSSTNLKWTCNKCIQSELPLKDINDNDFQQLLAGIDEISASLNFRTFPSYNIKSLLTTLQDQTANLEELILNNNKSKYYSIPDFTLQNFNSNSSFGFLHMKIIQNYWHLWDQAKGQCHTYNWLRWIYLSRHKDLNACRRNCTVCTQFNSWWYKTSYRPLCANWRQGGVNIYRTKTKPQKKN